MTALTVNQLVDLLAKEIAAGNGEHKVLVVVYGDSISAATIHDTLGAQSLEVRDLDVPDHPADGFVSLGAWPEAA